MSGRTAIGIVGAGRAGSALGVALARAGWPVRALSSRDEGRRRAIRELLPGVAVVRRPDEVAAAVDLVLLAVPDDVIVEVAREARARPGSTLAHVSGVHPASVLRPAVDDGVAVGAFHPLVAFADVASAADALRGASVAIDGDPAAVRVLGAMAEALEARPVVLGAGATDRDAATAKAAYHAAAVLAAGGFVALLDTIRALGAAAGLDEPTAIEVYGSLVRQGLANSARLGVAGALTGPVLRGDVGTVRRHLEAIGRAAPDTLDLYRAAARRQLSIARARGDLDADTERTLRSLLEG